MAEGVGKVVNVHWAFKKFGRKISRRPAALQAVNVHVERIEPSGRAAPVAVRRHRPTVGYVVERDGKTKVGDDGVVL